MSLFLKIAINKFREQMSFFLHTMLFIHTERIIEKQKAKERKKEGIDEDDGDDVY